MLKARSYAMASEDNLVLHLPNDALPAMNDLSAQQEALDRLFNFNRSELYWSLAAAIEG